jgi:hypothetical protein
VEKQMECRLAGETEVLGKNLPQRHFRPSQNPTWPDPGLNPGRRCGKPATNRLSYGAALQPSALRKIVISSHSLLYFSFGCLSWNIFPLTCQFPPSLLGKNIFLSISFSYNYILSSKRLRFTSVQNNKRNLHFMPNFYRFFRVNGKITMKITYDLECETM